MSEKMINEKREEEVSPLNTDTTNNDNEHGGNDEIYERQNNKWLKLLLWALLIGVILWIILGQKMKSPNPAPVVAIDSTQLINDSTVNNDSLMLNSPDSVTENIATVK